MPGEISEARLVAEAVTAGKERCPWRPEDGASEGTRSGAVSARGCDTQNGGCAFDFGGGAVALWRGQKREFYELSGGRRDRFVERL